MRELNAADNLINDPVPTQYRASTVPVTDSVRKLLSALKNGPRSPSYLRSAVGIKHRQTFRENYLNPALKDGLISLKNGVSPHDPNVRYSLTDMGLRVLNETVNESTKRPDVVINETLNERVNVLSSGVRTIKRTIKEDLLEVISRTPGVAGPALIAATGKGRTNVMEALAALRHSGKIEHRGSKKTGGYYIKEEPPR